MTKTSCGNFFEDFEYGQEFKHATPRTITSGDTSLYIALTGSQFALHCNQPFAQKLGFTDFPLDNLLVFHIAFGKTVPDISLNAVANLGYADVRFLKPVYVGDTLFVSSKVIGLKENSSGKTGVVYVQSIAKNQNEEEVLCWKRWVMVKKKEVSARLEPSSAPELPSFVSPEDLVSLSDTDFKHYDTEQTGSHYKWKDYKVGEIIDHVNGLTINDSDHTLATHLYQNNAKVHFNHHVMSDSPSGKRLVYGGHIISICRTLSHNGLANGFWLAAINSGTHSNPSYAGDTIYSQSQIIDKFEIGQNDIAAIRIRTLGIKNLPANELENVKIENNRKSSYHPNVVLDLDYTLFMPK